MWWAHGWVEDDGTDALPVLLKKGGDVVASKHDVLENLLFGHTNVGDWDTESDGLLQPELGCLTDFIDDISNLIGGTDGGRELTSPVEGWAEGLTKGLDDTFGGKEEVVSLSPVLDWLLLLVKAVKEGGIEASDTHLTSLLAVELVTDDTNTEVWTDDMWELDGTDKTLVLGDVVALQADLEIDGLEELPLLDLGRVLKDILDSTPNFVLVETRHC